MPTLGVPFGQLVVIQARAITSDPGKGGGEPLLRVLRIGDSPAPADLVLPWTYAGWHADQPARASWNGFVVEPECTYRLRGYETPGWSGVPAAAILMVDDFGPPQARSFGFGRWFRVFDGELLERGTLLGRDPERVSRRK